MGGGGGYYAVDFTTVGNEEKQFVCSGRTIPAFRWDKGKVYGLAIEGNRDYNIEYLYVHLIRRAMKFEPGFEERDSFLIVPNEFVPDHELTTEEIQAFMTPSIEYECECMMRGQKDAGKSRLMRFLQRIKNFLGKNWTEKLMVFKRKYNRIFRSKLDFQMSTEFIGDMNVQARRSRVRANLNTYNGG